MYSRTPAGSRRRRATSNVLVQQRQLDAVDPAGVRGDQVEHGLGRVRRVGAAPVAGAAAGRRPGRASAASPGVLGSSQQLAVDVQVVVGRPSAAAARWRLHISTGTAPASCTSCELLGVRLADVVQGGRAGRQLVGGDARARSCRRPRGPRAADAADQLAGRRVVQAHAALGGVHRLGHAEAVRPQVPPERQRRVPVRAPAGAPGMFSAAGSATTVRGGVRDPAGERPPGPGAFGAGPEGQRAVGQLRPALIGPAPGSRGGGPRGTTAGPARPSARRGRRPTDPTVYGASSATWRRNCSHWALKPLSNSVVVRHLLPLRRGSAGRCGRSGSQTGFGVAARGWIRQWCRPATALPCVPSTWNSTSSSRLTRTAQEELIWATMPPSESRRSRTRRRRRWPRTASPCSSQRRSMCVAARAVTARDRPEDLLQHVVPVREHVERRCRRRRRPGSSSDGRCAACQSPSKTQ